MAIFDILANPLSLSKLDMLHYSTYMSLVISILFYVAALQDFKERQVSYLLCMAIGLITTLTAFLFSNSIFATIICIIGVLYLTFGRELNFFGQADILIIIHFLTSYTFTSTGSIFIVIGGLVWIICLAVELLFYRTEEGKMWKPFKGIMIPAIPSYCASVIIMCYIRILCTDYLFYLGY